MKLYEIPKEIENLINNETGEITDIQLFSQLQAKAEEKLAFIGLINKNDESNIKALEEEIKNLAERKKRLENKTKNTKTFIVKMMDELGIDKIETPKVVLSFRNSKAVKIDDEEKLLEDFKAKGFNDLFKTKTTIAVDKTAVKKWLENNRSEYCHLEERKNLQIK